MLPEKAVNEFKTLYKKEFGEELSDKEASRLANYVFEFYTAVYLPIDSD